MPALRVARTPDTRRRLSLLWAPLLLAPCLAIAQETPSTEARSTDAVPLEEIQRYVAVFRTVKQAYVDEVEDSELMQAAIRGLLTDLDPHSAYLDRRASQNLSEAASGAYDGIGVELLQQPDRTLLVISPIDDTPAARAGLRPGDIITAIDGQPIGAGSVDEAVVQLRGPAGTEVRLTVLRDTQPDPLELVVVRDTIRVTSIRARTLAPGYGYLRIAVFQADTASELRTKLAELAKPGTLKGLVLDVRSNPGGLLNAAVEVADTFLDGGVVVSTRGRLPFANTEYSATPGDALAGAPIVVLIDSGSASASEVLAGALRDHRRALVMGTRSFGKGSVQTVLPLENGDSVKLTTARYYTPNGRSIQAAGIRPDITVAERWDWSPGDRGPTLREANLPRHLRGDAEDEAAAEEAAEAAAQAEAVANGGSEADQDPVIRQALNVLQGLAVFREGEG